MATSKFNMMMTNIRVKHRGREFLLMRTFFLFQTNVSE